MHGTQAIDDGCGNQPWPFLSCHLEICSPFRPSIQPPIYISKILQHKLATRPSSFLLLASRSWAWQPFLSPPEPPARPGFVQSSNWTYCPLYRRHPSSNWTNWVWSAFKSRIVSHDMTSDIRTSLLACAGPQSVRTSQGLWKGLTATHLVEK